MTDTTNINPELLQPEDVVKPKRIRKPKVDNTTVTKDHAKTESENHDLNYPTYDRY
jgi:hypothetical protein